MVYRFAALPTAFAAIADPEWVEFKTQYNKVYPTDVDEHERYELFQETKTRVAKLNKLNGEPVFGITWMADRRPDEKFKTGHLKPDGWTPNAPVKKYKSRGSSSIDWHQTEAITAIKNQGQCGSCWAFSATEAVESQMILTSGATFALELSPQQITSCTPDTGTYGCLGCQGGFTEGAYAYLESVAGLANSFFYPYSQSLTASSTTAACDTAKVTAVNGTDEMLQGGYAKVSGYHYATTPCTSGGCTSQNLDDLKSALESTPVSICVNAASWNDYTGGVLTSAACGDMGASYQDHCVMATGFNSTAATPYWIVRNSWSNTWGINGYIYLELDKNTCGLADDATIPEVSIEMTAQEQAEAAVRREIMFQKASQGSSQTVV